MSYHLIANESQDNRTKVTDDTADQLTRELQEVQSKVPEKFKGKSLEDVIAMYENAEKEKSRLGNELGQVRREAREALERPPEAKQKEKRVPVNVDQLLESPEEAVEQIVRQSPTVRKLEEQVETRARLEQQEQFETKYPTFRDDIQNTEFIEWVNNSAIRRALAASADSLDYIAANELWSMWDERKGLLKQAQKAQNTEKKERDLKAGMLESGSGTSVETKKTFNRREVRELKTRAKQGDRSAQAIVDDPKWQREVNAAYADGRIV